MNENVYLHDATVEAIEVDVPGRLARIRVSRYPSQDSRERVQSVIEFRNVQSFSGILDFMALTSNAWAGNIEDWQPSSGSGLSYIYLVRGVLSIQADEPVVS